MVPLLEQVVQQGKPLLIVAEDVDGEALATLVINRLRGTLNICAFKAPGYGDRRKAMMEDIAILTGGESNLRSFGTKLESVGLAQLGRAKKVIVDKDNTNIFEAPGKSVTSRLASTRFVAKPKTPPAITIVRSGRAFGQAGRRRRQGQCWRCYRKRNEGKEGTR